MYSPSNLCISQNFGSAYTTDFKICPNNAQMGENAHFFYDRIQYTLFCWEIKECQ